MVERLIFGMHHMNVTQSPGGDFSHPNKAMDIAGEDAGIDYWYNKQTAVCFKCIGSFGTRSTGNTRFYTPCDQYANIVKVLCADGVARNVTIAFTHSRKDFSIGKVIKPGEVLYQEGTAGRATGNHIHIEVAEGIQKTKKYDQKLGVYRMENELDPAKVFWILEGYTTITHGGGMKWQTTKSPRIFEESMEGIDISNYSDDKILETVPSQFVIAKATEGVNWKDPKYDMFATKIGNKKFGSYYFARPKNNNPIEDADFFIKTVREANATNGIVALDWETDPVRNVNWAKTWLDHVREGLGVIPFIYMSFAVEKAYDWSSVAKDYPLWLAHWSKEHGVLKNWVYPMIWQYADEKGYDKDIFYGSISDWNGFTYGSYLRGRKLGFHIRTKPVDGTVLTTVRKGDHAIIIGFGDKPEADRYRWVKTCYKGIVGYSQLDEDAYEIERSY